MSITVQIGLVLRGVDPYNFSVNSSLFNISTADFELHDVQKSITLDVGLPVEIRKDGELIFGGTITEANAELVDGLYRKWSITCQDYNASFARRIGPEREWLKTKATTIFRDLMAYISDEELDYSTVPPIEGPEIERFNIRYPTIEAAVKDLCSVSNHYYRVHYDKSVTFKPFAVGSNIGTITDTSADIANSQSVVTRENYANQIIVSLSNLTDQITDTATGETSKKDFTTTYPVVEKPVVTVNGSEQAVGLKGVDTGLSVYWLKDSTTISFETAPAAGDSISFTYRGRVSRLVDATDFAGIDERKAVEGGSGVYQKFIELDTESSVENAQAIADAELVKKKSLSTEISFESYTLSGVPGDLVTVNLTGVPNGVFVLRSVNTQMVGDGRTLKRSFQAVSGNLLSDAVATFSGFTGTSSAGIGGSVYIGPDPTSTETDPFGIAKVIDPAVTITYEPTEGGIFKARLSGSFVAPLLGADPYRFNGCNLFLERTEGVFDLGLIEFNGEAGETVIFDNIFTRLALQNEEWRIYFQSRSKTKENALVLAKTPADVNETPNVTIVLLSTLEIPDVVGFKAGGYDDATSTWAQIAEFDTLQERAKVEWGCVRPESKNFGGVEVWVRPNPDETWYQASGTVEAKSFINNQTFQAVYVEGRDMPVEGAIWDYMAVSVDRNGVRKVNVDGKPTGPVLAVTIPAKNGDVSFAVPSPVADLDFTVDPLHSVERSLLTVTFVAPSSAFAGVELWLVEDGSDPYPLGKYPISTSGPQTITAEFRPPESTATWTLYASSYTSTVQAKLDLTTTPHVTKTVNAYPLATAITDLDAEIEYRTNDGSKLVEYRFKATWTEPSDPPFWYAQIVYDDGANSHVLGEDDDGDWTSDWWTAPVTPVPAQLRFFSVNHARKRNELSYAFADVVVGAAVGSAGVEWSPTVTSFSASIQYRVSGDGVEQWRLVGSFTPSSDAKYAGCRIVIQDSGGRYTTVQDLSAADAAFTGDWWAIGGTETFTAYALSKDSTGRINTISVGITPRITGLVVALQTTGSLSGNRLATGTVNLPSFASGLRPVQVVGFLPSLPSSTYPQGAFVFLTSDNRVYRSTGSAWTAEVPTTALSGTITNTQIADNSISTPKLQANSVTSTNIASLNITASHLAANSVVSGKIQAGAISAFEIATSTITGTQMANGAISDVKISDLSIAKITSGTTFVTGDMIFSSTGGIRLLGGGSIIVSPGSITSAGGFFAQSLGIGWAITGGAFASINYTGTTAQINATQYSLAGATSISTSNVFVGAGVNCPSYGIAGAGFNPYQSGIQYFGTTGTGLRMITQVRVSGGVTQYCYRDFDIRGGVCSYISSEQGWYNA